MIAFVDVIDEVSPNIKRALENSKEYMRHVSKSVGWWIQKEVKDGIKSGSPGGDTFEKKTPYKYVRGKLNPKAPRDRNWYGKMKRAIGYQYRNGQVAIGWTSRTASVYADVQEYGTTRQVTDTVRKKFFSAGVGLRKSKERIVIPERPVFEPMVAELRPKVPFYVERKVNEYMTENVEFGKKSRRRYRVYSK